MFTLQITFHLLLEGHFQVMLHGFSIAWCLQFEYPLKEARP